MKFTFRTWQNKFKMIFDTEMSYDHVMAQRIREYSWFDSYPADSQLKPPQKVVGKETACADRDLRKHFNLTLSEMKMYKIEWTAYNRIEQPFIVPQGEIWL